MLINVVGLAEICDIVETSLNSENCPNIRSHPLGQSFIDIRQNNEKTLLCRNANLSIGFRPYGHPDPRCCILVLPILCDKELR